MPSPPFVDPRTRELDTTQILSEAIPLAKLMAVFVAAALVPFGVIFLSLGNSAVGMLFALVAQFILAVGTGIVLMYVVARGRQLS